MTPNEDVELEVERAEGEAVTPPSDEILAERLALLASLKRGDILVTAKHHDSGLIIRTLYVISEVRAKRICIGVDMHLHEERPFSITIDTGLDVAYLSQFQLSVLRYEATTQLPRPTEDDAAPDSTS